LFVFTIHNPFNALPLREKNNIEVFIPKTIVLPVKKRIVHYPPLPSIALVYILIVNGIFTRLLVKSNSIYGEKRTLCTPEKFHIKKAIDPFG